MASESGGVPRPVVGQGVNVVVLGAAEATILGGRVLLDRGRGLVVETSSAPGTGWTRGARVILIYAGAESVFALRGIVGEALTPNRFYVIPSSGPREMEKREYIRAELSVLSAVDRHGGAPGGLAPARVELSASGFRWYGASDASAGERVTLRFEVPGESGRTIGLPADLVRVERRGSTAEVAGRFVEIGPEDRDTVLRLVFQQRYAELGLQEES
jgi:hypothetical protein